MPTAPSSPPPNPAPRPRKRRMATYGVLTLLGTGALVLLNHTSPSEASLADWLRTEPPAIAQVLPGATGASSSNFIADAEIGRAHV